MAFLFSFAVRTGLILLRRIGPFHPEVIWARNAKPLLLRSKCFFVFRHSYSNKFSTSFVKTKNPMRNHRVLHFLRCGRDVFFNVCFRSFDTLPLVKMAVIPTYRKQGK